MKLPQLSLRELLLLVVIAAMGCGWWVHGSRQAATVYRLEVEKQQVERKAKVAEMLLEADFEKLDAYAPHWRELERHY